MGKLRHEFWIFTKAELSAMTATCIDFSVSYILAEACGLWYVLATTIGAITGGVANCCINYRWVFDATHDLKKRTVAKRFFGVWCGSIALNTLGTYLFTELSGVHFIIIKAIVAICVAILWNYQLQRRWVYKQ